MESVSGQIKILWSRQSIEPLIADPETPDSLRKRLATVLNIRDFATAELALENNKSYRKFVNLNRSYVAWNVFAAPEFSLRLYEQCYPFAGCIQYRGYFTKKNAITYARKLEQHGYESYVSGVPAYSTLGWFDDPVFNTVLKYKDSDLAGLIFHELAHQKLYVKNDTAFNEGFARTVEIAGVKLWMEKFGTMQEWQRYKSKKGKRQDFLDLISRIRLRLQKLYDANIDADLKKEQKDKIFVEMNQEYQKLKQQWNGYDGYDNWFNKKHNNASIGSIVTYADYVPSFQKILEQQNMNFTKFYVQVKKISKLSKPDRTRLLFDLK